MFGYVLPDKPNMFIKDFTLYRAFYCGLCKTIGKKCGQLMRLTTNYDITFLNVLAHGITGTDIEISNEVCILNPLKKKSVVKQTPLMLDIMDANTILAHYKAADDVQDNKSALKRLADAMVIRRHFKKACKRNDAMYQTVKSGYERLAKLEGEGCENLDMVADCFAGIMRELTKIILKDNYSDAAGEMMYNLGRWVYFADALDDLGEDAKKGEYNCFLVNYQYKDRQTFLADKGDEAKFVLNSCYNAICDNFDNVKMSKYEGIITNIIWYGLKEQTDKILRRTTECKQKTRM